MKKVLLLSIGPFPTPEQEHVEGGGLRIWGLATGLISNNKSLSITVSYHESYKQAGSIDKLNGINIKTWNYKNISELILQHDSIVVSYCAGTLTTAVLDVIQPNQQLILDGYVPIYIEISARSSSDLQREFIDFNAGNEVWNRALNRCDILLCANEQQRDFYRGVLASVGRINPVTYGDNNLIQVVPYGIYRDSPVVKQTPITKILHNKKAFKLLWFGGIYPWFDLTSLLKAVKIINEKIPLELIMVGVKNPFNNNPDFIAKYDEVIKFIKDNKLGKYIHLVDWVQYETRADWYLDCDAVILINKDGEENELAWRTRLVDYVWADLLIITNGGDPLSNILEKNKAVKILKTVEIKDIVEVLQQLAKNPKEHLQIIKNLANVRKTLYWDEVTKGLTELIVCGYKPEDIAMRVIADNMDKKIGSGIDRAPRIVRIPTLAIRFIKEHGLLAYIKTMQTVIYRKLNLQLKNIQSNDQRIVVISHQLDNTGAPFVIMDVVKDLVTKYPKLARYLNFITFLPFDSVNVKKLNKLGVRTSVYIDNKQEIEYNNGDVVILNSFALSREVIMSTLTALQDNKIKKVFWYGHEATPEGFLNNDCIGMINKLIKQKRLAIYAVSYAVNEEYKKYFNVEENIFRMPFRFDFPVEKIHSRDEEDFNKLKFIMIGNAVDGRKGQLPTLYAFLSFYNNYYVKRPQQYRDFHITFVGMNANNYITKQLELSSKGLGSKISLLKGSSHKNTLNYIENANVTICNSVHEALAITVYEGMALGHPIIRNESGGQKEQLVDGKNGFKIDSSDFNGLVRVIEKMLNKSEVSNERLMEMSRVSNAIAKKATSNDYYIIDEIVDIFKTP